MKKWITVLALSVAVCFAAAGCQVSAQGNQKKEQGSGYYFYYLNSAGTRLEREAYEPESADASLILEDLMRLVANKTLEGSKTNLLPADVEINTYDPGEDGVLTVDFNREYHEMSRAREVLVRAGVVKNFVQIPGIQAVRFTVNGEALLDSRGNEMGEMSGGDFVEETSRGMDTYRHEVFTLYFTDKTGQNLVEEKRSVYYRRELSKEQVVLEQLAKGPMEKGNYPTIPGNTRVQDVKISDGICYLDLNRSFFEAAPDVSQEAAIYSVVNSVLEICDAQRVQISIDGQSDLLFGESMDLYQFYEKNDSLVVVSEQGQE